MDSFGPGTSCFIGTDIVSLEMLCSSLNVQSVVLATQQCEHAHINIAVYDFCTPRNIFSISLISTLEQTEQ